MIESVTAYIALGSNMVDRFVSMRRAVKLLTERDGIIVDCRTDVASLYETDPVGGPAGQARFLNSALRTRTSLKPLSLMEALLEIERTMGRQREVRWESRVIDLDLLLYGQLQFESPTLTLPHPRLHDRRFVLEPLAEIAGDVMHPMLGVTIDELNGTLRKTSIQGIIRIAGPEWVLRE